MGLKWAYVFLRKINRVVLTKVKLKNTEIKTINNDKNFKCICFIYSTIKLYFMSLILSILYPDKNSFADNSGNYRLVTVDKYRHPQSPDRNVNLEAYSCQYTLSSWNQSGNQRILFRNFIMNTTVSVRLSLVFSYVIISLFLNLDRYGSKKVRNLTLELIL